MNQAASHQQVKGAPGNYQKGKVVKARGMGQGSGKQKELFEQGTFLRETKIFIGLPGADQEIPDWLVKIPVLGKFWSHS